VSPAAAGSFSGNVFTADPAFNGSAVISYDVTYNYVVPYDAGQNETVNCSASAPIDIICGACNLAVSESHTNVNCAGGNDASASVTTTGATGPVIYSWSDGSVDASRTGLASGNYTVTATDGAACTASTVFAITEPASVVSVICTYTNATIGHNNGTAGVTASGGTPPYNYLWTTGETSSQVTGLAPGSYTVSVTDANGCSAECSIFIIQGFPLATLLRNFEVSEDNCAVNLLWETEAEMNAQYFSVLRKAEKETTFQEIGRVNARGNSNDLQVYHYTDRSNEGQRYTYKISVVDLDAQISESRQLSAMLSCTHNGGVNVYPNPVTEILNVSIDGPAVDNYQIKLSDMTGRVIMTTNVETATAIVPLQLNGLANGMYQVTVSGSVETRTFKIQKYQ
jgi:hypothetical protein